MTRRLPRAKEDSSREPNLSLSGMEAPDAEGRPTT